MNGHPKIFPTKCSVHGKLLSAVRFVYWKTSIRAVFIVLVPSNDAIGVPVPYAVGETFLRTETTRGLAVLFHLLVTTERPYPLHGGLLTLRALYAVRCSGSAITAPGGNTGKYRQGCKQGGIPPAKSSYALGGSLGG